MYQIEQSTLIDIGVYTILIAAGLTLGWLLRMWQEAGLTPVPDQGLTRFEIAMSRWRRMTQAAEGTLLDNVAATTPWLAPLLPASIAYANMRAYLGFDVWLAFVGALVIEFLGLAAVHTSFQLWQYNETKNQSDESAPFYWAVGAVVVYLSIVILVNVILEAANVTTWTSAALASVVAKALLSLLSIVAAFVLALRSQHARRLSVKQEAHEERSRAVELGRLRKAKADLETRMAQMDQELTAVKEERDILKGVGAKLDQERHNRERLETKLKQIQGEHETAVTERERLETLWNTLPGDVKAAAVYHVGGGTVRELAEEYGTSPASVSRAGKRLFTENGNVSD